MWKSFLSAAILFSCTHANASFVPITECEGSNKTHVLRFNQDGTDVLVSLDDNAFAPASDFNNGGTPNKKYKVSAKNLSRLKVEGAVLPELLKGEKIKDLITSMMYGRSEFAGEADMVYYYASELLQALNCK